MVHRDIKPDNVMLRADGLVKILDFGIATRTGSDLSLTPAGTTGPGGAVIGTTGYMSPEQRQGLPVDARTDVWSVGTVIYEMATGRLPADVASAYQDGGLRTESTPSLADLAHLPPGVGRIVGRALSRERADRYATASRGEARAILDRLQTRAAQTYVPPSNLALVHLGLGERDAALDRLEEAVEARDLLLTFLTVEPRWADLAGHPRFTALLGKVGLKQ